MVKRSIPGGAVLVIKVKDDLFCLAQMGKNHYLQFYDIQSTTPEISDVNLNSAKRLFAIFVAESKLASIIAGQVGQEFVTPDNVPFPRTVFVYVLSPPASLKLELVEMDDAYTSSSYRIIKDQVNIERDLDDIYTYEFAGVVGEPEKIVARLQRYFETGVNWDDAKTYLFPGIKPPQPEK